MRLIALNAAMATRVCAISRRIGVKGRGNKQLYVLLKLVLTRTHVSVPPLLLLLLCQVAD